MNVLDTFPWRNEWVLVLEMNSLSIGLRMVNIPSCMQELTSKQNGGVFMVIGDKVIYVDNFVRNVVSLCAQKNE